MGQTRMKRQSNKQSLTGSATLPLVRQSCPPHHWTVIGEQYSATEEGIFATRTGYCHKCSETRDWTDEVPDYGAIRRSVSPEEMAYRNWLAEAENGSYIDV